MYMVGGGSGRVSRRCKAYPGARRWMQPPKIKREFDWGLAVDIVMAFGTFGILIWTLQLVALYFG